MVGVVFSFFLFYFIFIYLFFAAIDEHARAHARVSSAAMCTFFFSFWDVKFAVWLFSGMCDKPLRGCRLTDRGSVHTLPVLTMISGGC